VSIGATSFLPGPDVSHELAIRRADQALYRAKNAGRDRCVVLAQEAPVAPVLPMEPRVADWSQRTEVRRAS
jgi:predicted signal transduction protein with EAL and GGDEF domain